ncbi:hypothetical protein ACOMHN_054117 [Nucella lapillus]
MYSSYASTLTYGLRHPPHVPNAPEHPTPKSPSGSTCPGKHSVLRQPRSPPWDQSYGTEPAEPGRGRGRYSATHGQAGSVGSSGCFSGGNRRARAGIATGDEVGASQPFKDQDCCFLLMSSDKLLYLGRYEPTSQVHLTSVVSRDC